MRVCLLRNAAQTARAPNMVQHCTAPKAGTNVLAVCGPVTYVNAREVLARGIACPSAASSSSVQRNAENAPLD